MGIACANLELRNPVRCDLAAVPVRALADTGAMYLCIPRHVAIQLGLSAHQQREVTLADGTRAPVDYVGPVEVRFGNRRCFVGAMVLGDEVLLGAIPMEDMDLVVHPQTRQVTVHPDRPNIAAGIAKRAA
ncbi:MAG: clan AA aspartic protease [Gammaproteobacteria bacterium]|nr:clan AA aspartic protease [Gammaproteobacteria bacterium]